MPPACGTRFYAMAPDAASAGMAMKNIAYLTLRILRMLTRAVEAADSRPISLNVGATVWYGWWKSDYLEKFIPDRTGLNSIMLGYETTTVPLYGPVLSIDFLKFKKFKGSRTRAYDK